MTLDKKTCKTLIRLYTFLDYCNMNTTFFLENRSPNTVCANEGRTWQEFVKFVTEVVKDHGWNAVVYPAMSTDSKEENERYGVVVDLTYGYPNAVVDVAQTLKDATNQDKVLLYARGQYVPGSFVPGKIATSVADDDGSLQDVALRMHNAQKAFAASKYFRSSVVVYQMPDGQIRLLSVYNPDRDANYDYWQKMLIQMLRGFGLRSSFWFASVENL